MERRLRLSAALALVALAAALVSGCTRTVSSPQAATTRTVEPTRSVAVTPTPPGAEESTEVVASEKTTIAQTAEKSPGLSTLNELLQASGLEAVLAKQGPYTLFAPTDQAFAKLPRGWVDKLRDPANKEKTLRLLRYHLLTGKVSAQQMLTWRQLVTFEGGLLTVHHKEPLIFLNDHSDITSGGVPASNGTIHVVNKVLVPEGFEP